MFSVRSRSAMSLAVVLAAAAAPAGAQKAELPLKYTGKPTTGAITPTDLMTRLYIFADDSMMGREVGTKYNAMGTAYIEREVRRLGLVPAGDNGGYFQNIPLFNSTVDTSTSVSVAGEKLTIMSDFLPVAGRDERRLALDGTPVVYAGCAGDSTTWLSGDDMAGKIVVLGLPAPMVVPPPSATLRSRIGRAAAVMIVSLERIPANQKLGAVRAQWLQKDGMPTPPTAPPSILITQRVANLIFGNIDAAHSGDLGKPLVGSLVVVKEPAGARNVVAILPGGDAALKGQYVAIGAHNDHIGLRRQGPVDHDSIRAFNIVARPQGADSPNPRSLNDEQKARIRTMIDSMRALHSARPDSINNGADDDGSGTVSTLEIAEAFATSKTKPKRSMLFIWHTGEEAGLWGSEFFTDHPTVPRDSIVAELNMDMVGRGATNDITGESKTGDLLHGGPGYLQLVGSRRLSTELGDLLESVNTKGKYGLVFDYAMDANGHAQNIYCRSDHYEYARYGIPIAFMTTGGHADYHQVTDEPQYIDYGRMAEVARFVYAAALEVANLDHRIVVDKPKPDPKGRCVQ